MNIDVRSKALPHDVLRLREQVFRDETQFLSDADLSSSDDVEGAHVCLYQAGVLAGAALGLPAERSSFASRTGIPAEQMAGHYYVTRVMIAPEFRAKGLAAMLVYALFREGRILGRRTAVGLFTEMDAVPARLTGAVPFRNFAPLDFTGHEGRTFKLQAMLADINYGMHCCWDRLSAEQRTHFASLPADEIVRTVLIETSRFYENPWFQRVANGTLTRQQYVEFLSNNHQFVRWTTRILARVAGLAEDGDLRNHYLHHLSGEIDHEKLIERDLAYLGADVEYVRRYMAPCVDVGHFMGVQESLVGFRADPVGLLAVPIAIESLTAHLSGRFLMDLENCVQSWGYEEPARATSYLRSHVPLDGGVDGHWARTAQVIQQFIKTEPEAQRFLGTVRMVIVAIDRALRSYVEHHDFR
jgi:GNAT superfamily N-acetyltransferase